MSRCFPYPPPNYRKEEIFKSLVTESIKLEKERDLTKERRKEKKEKKKERKEKRDNSKDKSESSKHREHGHKKRKHDERNGLQMKDGYQKAAATKDGYQKAAVKGAIEQLERSGLTEEHGLPCPMQEPCESSESTQNSSKSRKLESANVTGGSQGSTILRLRLPLQKHRDPKPAPVNDDEPCFSGRVTYKDAEAAPSNEEPCFSGRATGAPLERDSSANARSQDSSRIKSSNKITEILLERQYGDNFHGHSSAVTKSSMTTEAPMELECQPSATIKNSKPIEAPVVQELVESSHSRSSSRNKGSKKTRELERQFRNLVMNWKAPPFLLDTEPGTEDLAWLSKKSGQHSLCSDTPQSCQVSSIVEEPSHGSGVSYFQTRACYLPELEMYQLPYVAPF